MWSLYPAKKVLIGGYCVFFYDAMMLMLLNKFVSYSTMFNFDAKVSPNLMQICPKYPQEKCIICTTTNIYANKVPKRCLHLDAQMFSWVANDNWAFFHIYKTII